LAWVILVGLLLVLAARLNDTNYRVRDLARVVALSGVR
jgi:hypothetical protein